MRMKTSLLGRGGFTLIEIMVVIAILATLIASGSLMIGIAMKKQKKMTTEGRLQALASAIEQLRSNDQLGRYPPTQISKLKITGFDGSKFGGEPNATNLGIETLYVVFRLPGINVMPPGLDDAIENTDDDKALAPLGKLAKSDLFEYVDAWGNPIVYINSTDYRSPEKVEQYVLGNEARENVKVAPRKNEKSGEVERGDSYQLFSIGADQKPGTDDDIHFGSM
jgi:prepilin-type N-terminal cleavage/methylation domain-containing protein